jgi:Adenosylmethionine decarboxylase
MTELDFKASQQFVRTPAFVSSTQTTRDTGIDMLLPGAKLDDHMFEPCGCARTRKTTAIVAACLLLRLNPFCTAVSTQATHPAQHWLFIQIVVLSRFTVGADTQ